MPTKNGSEKKTTLETVGKKGIHSARWRGQKNKMPNGRAKEVLCQKRGFLDHLNQAPQTVESEVARLEKDLSHQRRKKETVEDTGKKTVMLRDEETFPKNTPDETLDHEKNGPLRRPEKKNNPGFRKGKRLNEPESIDDKKENTL